MTSAVGTLDTLQHMLMQELALEAALQEAKIQAGGLFNKIKTGAFALSDVPPDEIKLTEMNNQWLPEVKITLQNLFNTRNSCETTDRMLNENLTKMTPLINRVIHERDLHQIALCNPNLAEQITHIDRVAKELLKKIQGLHTKNGAHLDKLHKSITKLDEAELDKWRYCIAECDGRLPGIKKWMLSNVVVGAFKSEIERSTLPPTPLPVTETSRQAARDIMAPYSRASESSTTSSFSERAQALQAEFDSSFTALNGFSKRVKYMQGVIRQIETLTATSAPLATTIIGVCREDLDKVTKYLTDVSSNTTVYDTLQTNYDKLLSLPLSTEDLTPGTLEHLEFLDPLLQAQAQATQEEARKHFATLKAHQSWLQEIDRAGLTCMPDKIAALSAKLSA